MFKVNNKDTRFVVFLVNFEKVSHIVLVVALLTLNKLFDDVFIVNFECIQHVSHFYFKFEQVFYLLDDLIPT